MRERPTDGCLLVFLLLFRVSICLSILNLYSASPMLLAMAVSCLMDDGPTSEVFAECDNGYARMGLSLVCQKGEEVGVWQGESIRRASLTNATYSVLCSLHC